MAAGRNDPREALAFVARHLRPQDAVCIGFFMRDNPLRHRGRPVVAGRGVGDGALTADGCALLLSQFAQRML
jgi:hypothetical protein